MLCYCAPQLSYSLSGANIGPILAASRRGVSADVGGRLTREIRMTWPYASMYMFTSTAAVYGCRLPLQVLMTN